MQPSPSPHPASPKTVLIVEDEFAVANNLRMILTKAGYFVSGIAFSADEALELNRRQRPDLVLLDIFLQGQVTGIDLAGKLAGEDIPFIYISANTNSSVLEQAKTTQPYGFLVKPFREKDVLVALEIAHFRHAHRIEVRLREEQALQLALITALSAEGEWVQRMQNAARLFQAHIPFDYLIFGFEKEQMVDPFLSCSFFRAGHDEYQTINSESFLQMMGLDLKKYQKIRADSPTDERGFFNGADFEARCARNPLTALIARTFRLAANLIVPLKTAQHGTFYISFYSREPDTYASDHLQILDRLQPSLTVAVDRLLAFDKIERLSRRLHEENTYLIEEVKTTANFEEVIGEAPSLRNVFSKVERVAPTDYTVLITGETGTGKELIARAVHNRSRRKGKPLIKVNCAALPPQLIESELFGHEKGSFTGATEKRLGKFELADGGTIFLDEIGELPLELQPKLLRVLQEKEIERVGGKGSFSCDVRVIAATNRNLEHEIAARRFREDLYYRLNVFPIQLPPLRERRGDLALLTTHFLQKISKKLGKELKGLSAESIAQMQSYHWPGNVRELEHLLERAAIMANTPVVSLVDPLTAFKQVPAATEQLPDVVVKPYDQAERDNVLAALRLSNYRIRGKGGAAELLRLKPTTLEGRMARMGIQRDARPDELRGSGETAERPD